MFLTYTGVTVVYKSGVEVYETHDESIGEVRESLLKSLAELGVKALISDLSEGDITFHFVSPSNIAYILLHEVRL